MNSRLTERELLNRLLRLLNHTTPHGTERTLAPLLPHGGIWDDAGNYIVEVGTGSQTMFACHLDTVCSERMKTRAVYNQGMVYSRSRRCPIGADDKAGVLCLIAMIHAGIPGTYLFHAGEECGGIGAHHIAGAVDLSMFKRAIEFDRRGMNSVITAMGWVDTCSDAFALAMCDQLGMGFQPDPTGIFTDVAVYADIIPEVTNISVGYRNNHSDTETLDAGWLIGKLIPRLYSVEWESLPVERDPAMDTMWHPRMAGNWYGDWDPYAGSCDMCGESGRLQDVDLGDGCTYLLCRCCIDAIRWQYGLERETRQMELSI